MAHSNLLQFKGHLRPHLSNNRGANLLVDLQLPPNSEYLVAILPVGASSTA